jgi:hypothetical protein
MSIFKKQFGTKALSALKLIDPEAWRAQVKAAMAEADGHVSDHQGKSGAATILGVSRDKLFIWLREDPKLARLPRAAVGTPVRKEQEES